MKSYQTYIVAAFFALVGISIFVYKSVMLDFPLLPNKKADSWHIEAKIEVTTNKSPVAVKLFLPRQGKKFSIVDENFISQGFNLSTNIEDETKNRFAKWTRKNVDGKEVIFYRAVIYGTNSLTSQPKEPKVAKSTVTYRDDKFKSLAKEQPVYLAISSIISELNLNSKNDKDFINNLVKIINNPKDERVITIMKDHNDVEDKQDIMYLILKYSGFSAKIVHGLVLEDVKRKAVIKDWVEYYSDKKWHIVNGLEEDLSKYNLLPWWYGNKDLIEVSGAKKYEVTMSVKRHTESALTEAIWQGSKVSAFVENFSIFALPLDVQLLFHVLLLVPIGCLVSGIVRQLIGINTFGTFMPVLVALAFRETHLLWGVIFFVFIVTIGLVFRSYFDKLQLLMIPRLTAILTIVVLTIFVISIVCFKFSLSPGLSISLFPIVILTMVIERITLKWEEHGPSEAFSVAINSLIVAIIAYWFMNNNLMVHLIITFPELLFVVLAIALLLGRYNGYKLMEYRRFRVLKERHK